MSAALLMLSLLTAAPQAVDAGSDVATPIHFQSSLSAQKVRLGEPFTYELMIEHAPGERYEVQRPKDLGAFELLETTRQRRDGSTSSTTTFQLKMSVFELGTQRLPDLTFDVFSPQGTRHFTAPGLTLEVESTLPPDAAQKGEALRDIKDPADVPVRTYRVLAWLAGLLALIAAGYGLYRWLNRVRQAVPVQSTLPLEARTRRALDALQAEDLPGKGRTREYYFRLSEILRGYLGQRYQFEALECTTPELVTALRKLAPPGLQLEAFVGFLQHSDLVKFARGEASATECDRDLELAHQIVIKTTPVIAPPPQGNAPRPPVVS